MKTSLPNENNSIVDFISLKKLQECIVSDKKSHCLWLNTLSFLEYVGCRKIVKSQRAENIRLETLLHIQEESRHALFFKKLIPKIDPDIDLSFGLNDFLGGSTGERYLQDIDQFVYTKFFNSDPNSSFLVYNWVTWFIEYRACILYKSLEEATESLPLKPYSLKSLLNEEEHHMAESIQLLKKLDPKFDKHMELGLKHEADFFVPFIQEVQNDLNKSKFIKNTKDSNTNTKRISI